MSLDRTLMAVPYLVGRAAAIVERYASEHFCPGAMGIFLSQPAFYIAAFARYIPADDADWQEIGNTEWPHLLTMEQRGQAWVGYDDQRAAWDGGGRRRDTL